MVGSVEHIETDFKSGAQSEYLVLAAASPFLRQTQNRHDHPPVHRSRRNVEGHSKYFRVVLPPIKADRERRLVVGGLKEGLSQKNSIADGFAGDVNIHEGFLDDARVQPAAMAADGRVEAIQRQSIAGFDVIES